MLEQECLDPGQTEMFRSVPAAAWFDNMNRNYKGMFLSEQRYAFLLCSTSESIGGPLGIVVVETHDNRERSTEQTVSATLVFLELVAEIISFRQYQQSFGSWPNFLSASRRQTKLKKTWRDFAMRFDKLGELLKGIESTCRSSEDESSEDWQSLQVLRRTLEKEIEHVCRTRLPMEPTAAKKEGDLTSFLKNQAAIWNEHGAAVHLDIDDIRSVGLPCAPSILQDAFNCLIENAKTACDNRDLVLRIAAKREASSRGTYPQVVKISVVDSGPGILPEDAPFIFLDGFTTKEHGGHQGRGLSLARAQLQTYRGDLQLEDAGGQRDRGATFAIRFGIPRLEMALGDPLHNSASDDRS
jgi:hypothetical protein